MPNYDDMFWNICDKRRKYRVSDVKKYSNSLKYYGDSVRHKLCSKVKSLRNVDDSTPHLVSVKNTSGFLICCEELNQNNGCIPSTGFGGSLPGIFYVVSIYK